MLVDEEPQVMIVFLVVFIGELLKDWYA